MNAYIYMAFVCHRLFEFLLLIINFLLININFRFQILSNRKEKVAFDANQVVSLLEIDQESNQFAYSRQGQKKSSAL